IGRGRPHRVFHLIEQFGDVGSANGIDRDVADHGEGTPLQVLQLTLGTAQAALGAALEAFGSYIVAKALSATGRRSASFSTAGSMPMASLCNASLARLRALAKVSALGGSGSPRRATTAAPKVSFRVRP